MKFHQAFMMMFMPLIIMGCSSTGTVQEGTDISDQPKWVQNMGKYPQGIGYAASAPKSPLGSQTQRDEAIMNARNELGRQIEIRIRNAVSQTSEQMREAGNERGDVLANQFNRNVSRQVVKSTLAGSRPVKQWKDPKSEELYVWVVIDKKNVIARVSDSMKKSLNRAGELHKEDLEILDEEIRKTFSAN